MVCRCNFLFGAASLSARRAWIEIPLFRVGVYIPAVALRKESVDRNLRNSRPALRRRVALRKESVDRNHVGLAALVKQQPSLSARRAWIEIWSAASRNNPGHPSLSARRAWIEISMLIYSPAAMAGRSPQGERG